MILEKLYMARQSYGPNIGKLEGELEFSNPKGKIQLILNDETCNKILGLCAEGMVQSAQQVAKELTAAIISSVPTAITYEEVT